MSVCLRRFTRAVGVGLMLISAVGRADPNVVVTSTATPGYTREKFDGDKPKAETYVVMQGRYYEGATVDRSIERMPFRRIAEVFAPELARREYWPVKVAAQADLLIIVHWGTTQPRISSDQILGRTSPVTDPRDNGDAIRKQIMQEQAGSDGVTGVMLGAYDPVGQQAQLDQLDHISDDVRTDLTTASNAQLLGYTSELRRLGSSSGNTAEEYTLRSDLNGERYFIILKAYSLHEKLAPGHPRRPVWTLHLNMSSPGNNFTGALAQMSLAAVDYFGRASDGVQTLRPDVREGRVEVGAPTILHDKK